MTDHRVLLSRAGEHDGHEDAVLFLFAGMTDNLTVLMIANGIIEGNERILASLPLPSQRVPYPPTGAAIGELVLDQESPYTWYLELCEAYDTAYTEAVHKHIRTVADAIRSGMM